MKDCSKVSDLQGICSSLTVRCSSNLPDVRRIFRPCVPQRSLGKRIGSAPSKPRAEIDCACRCQSRSDRMNAAHVEAAPSDQRCSMRPSYASSGSTKASIWRHKSADRCGALGREHFGLLHCLRAEADGQVLLSGLGHDEFSHINNVYHLFYVRTEAGPSGRPPAQLYAMPSLRCSCSE